MHQGIRESGAVQRPVQGNPKLIEQVFQLIMQESSCNAQAVGNNGLPKGQSASWGCGLMQIESIHAGNSAGSIGLQAAIYSTSASSCFYPANNIMMASQFSPITRQRWAGTLSRECARTTAGSPGRATWARAHARRWSSQHILAKRAGVPETPEILKSYPGELNLGKSIP